MIPVGLIVLAYLLGSVSSAIVACRLMGLPDPRTHGSHNPGATNVLRIGGKKAAAVTLAGDMLKGVVPVVAAHLVGSADVTLILVAAAAFLGHLYPVFFAFRGGKGVATLLGTLLGLQIWAGLATVATWLVVAAVVRISSVAALVATATAPVWIWYWTRSTDLVIGTTAMTALLYWRHRSNIRNLLSGKEGTIRGPDKGSNEEIR